MLVINIKDPKIIRVIDIIFNDFDIWKMSFELIFVIIARPPLLY